MRYEVIAWDGFARWLTRKAGLRTRKDARLIKYHWIRKTTFTPTGLYLKWPIVKIYNRKLKKFIT